MPLSIYFNKYFTCVFLCFAELFLLFLPIIYNDVRAYMVNIGSARLRFGKIVQRFKKLLKKSKNLSKNLLTIKKECSIIDEPTFGEANCSLKIEQHEKKKSTNCAAQSNGSYEVLSCQETH